MSRRVVVTGIGLVTPVGTGVQKTWDGLLAGKSGVGPITRFDASAHMVQIAAEVHDFNVEDYMTKKESKHLELFVQYALGAADMAIKDSGFGITEENSVRVGSVVGCGLGGLPSIEKYHTVCMERGPKRITPFFIPMVIPNMGGGQISIFHKTRGPNLSTCTACAAGTHAVGEAFRLIQSGACDVSFTGGSESVICDLAVGGFNAMKALSRRNDSPETASRPFDKDRNGFIIAEGGGIIILEELEHAKARGAKIYAEMVGYGLTGDGHHIAAPPADGNGAIRCMEMALNDAGMNPDEIDYINAHGTSTPLNDVVETRAIKAVYGDHANNLAISSTKSMTGHMLGGAGGIEACFSALTLHHQVAPQTANLTNPDPECDLDYIPEGAREMNIRAVMSNSFGFGGTNAVIVMKRYEGK